jgi:hypothetical protein
MARTNDLFSSGYHGRLDPRIALAVPVAVNLLITTFTNIQHVMSHFCLGVIQLLTGSQQSLFLGVKSADISVPIPTSDVICSQGNRDSAFEIKLHCNDAAAAFAGAFGPKYNIVKTLLQLGPGHPAKVLRESKPN